MSAGGPGFELPAWMPALVMDRNRGRAAAALGPSFLRATGEERSAVAAGWSFGATWPYPDPARLACRTGETTSPLERIVSSLVLDSLENIFGTREHLIALSATYRSCELAGLSPSDVFSSVAAVLPASHADALRAFLRRQPEDRSLGAFGLVERTNEDGEYEIHPQ